MDGVYDDELDDSLFYALDFFDVLLVALIFLSIVTCIQLTIRFCSRKMKKTPTIHSLITSKSKLMHEDIVLQWKSHLPRVLQRQIESSAVHIDLPRLSDRIKINGLDSLSLSPSFQQKSSIKSSVSSSASSTTDDQDDDEPNDEIVKQRVVAIVSTLLDDLDNENVPKKQYCQQLEEAMSTHIDTDAILNVLKTFDSNLKTLSVLKASTNQGVMAPAFIALRRSFASSPSLKSIRFANQPRSWQINVNTCATQTLSELKDKKFSFNSNVKPESVEQYFIKCERIVRIDHCRQFECFEFKENTKEYSIHVTFDLIVNILLGLPDESFKNISDIAFHCQVENIKFVTPVSDEFKTTLKQAILKALP